jgi:hypothetical protein
MSPSGTLIEPLKTYSASKTGFKHLDADKMLKIPADVKAEMDILLVQGINLDFPGKKITI